MGLFAGDGVGGERSFVCEAMFTSPFLVSQSMAASDTLTHVHTTSYGGHIQQGKLYSCHEVLAGFPPVRL